MNVLRDALALPLDGIRVVEASAGTGKTFTIATLYLRLILERGLQVEEIVVATFTRAAAAELSQRLRQRLAIADALLAGDAPGTPRDGDDGETRETRKVVAQALRAGAPLDAVRAHARDARLALDTAFIGTLHGFCHRVLAEFGFETGQALEQPELIDDLRALQTEIVRDFWRRGSADAVTARRLADTWGSPDELAAQVCDPRWRGREVELPEPDRAASAADFEAAVARIRAWSAEDLAEFERELQRCVKDARARNNRLAALQGLRAWATGADDDPACVTLDGKAAASLAAANIEALKPEGASPQGRVVEDIEALLSACTACSEARAVAAERPAAELLRDARAFLETQLPRRLAERNLMGHDQAVDRLAAALADPVRGAAAATRIRARWKAALIDEFQDTDARQWQVARALFGGSTLVLVGDPKQAIYGFRGGDVFAWLDAAAHAQGEPLRLAESHRAGAGIAHATNALFSTPGAFIEAGIEHPDLRAADTVAARALLRDGRPLPALQLWRLDSDRIGHADNRLPSKDHARRAIQHACVAWIAALLDDPAVQVRQRDGCAGRLLPKHIAVLVNSNAEAQAMQAALGRSGVPAASNLRASVYASDEAADLTLLLDALAAPDDARRARAASASVLVGDAAAAIAADVADADAQAALLERVAEWASGVRRHGLLPWLHGLLAQAAPRLLALPDGARRVANYQQLAELLHDLHARSFGVGDLATRFARARVEAADDADAARLRLDTDADAVTVSTVHAAKGLEYEVVLLPFAVLAGDSAKPRGAVPLRWYHAGNAARVAIGAGAGDAIDARAGAEVRAEEVRKFYVAVTRASALCVLPWGAVSGAESSPAFGLLHRAGRAPAEWLALDAASCQRALADLCTRAHGAAEIVELPCPHARVRPLSRAATADPRARRFTRATLERDWQTWSFSRLVRGSGNGADPLPGNGDADAAAAYEPGLAGARFGSAVHAVFERTDFAAWRDAAGVPDCERALIERSLHEQGLAEGDAALQRALTVTGDCLRAALNATLPCGTRLCDIAPAQRRAEIEFHLTLASARTPELYALLHRHGYQTQRSGVAPQRLHGLLTGKIDLTFAHAERFHIVDWKTNRCAPYDDAALRAEIALHDYDLQWLIYTLALHRWLRQQLPGYDYDAHVGEAYYLFVRGMQEGRGVHADRPPRALVEAMDALFDARAEKHA